jgi:hypothetical protein
MSPKALFHARLEPATNPASRFKASKKVTGNQSANKTLWYLQSCPVLSHSKSNLYHPFQTTENSWKVREMVLSSPEETRISEHAEKRQWARELAGTEQVC